MHPIVTSLRNAGERARTLWRVAPWGSRAAAALVLAAALALLVALPDDAGLWVHFLLAGLTGMGLASLIAWEASQQRVHDLQAELVVAETELGDVLTEKPTGAPRVAHVTCSHGATHRFIYGPHGWEESGPAIQHHGRM